MTAALARYALDFYARHKCALFPCRAGTKAPILKWKEGSTTDLAQIAAWVAEGHNLAIDCAKSELIVIDVDASKVTREQAWKAYTDLCAAWSLSPIPLPMTQSARGGWHIPFRRPADLQATDLHGGGTLVKISDVRALNPGEKDGEVIGFKNRGYCIAAGSYLTTDAGDLPYLAMPNAASPAPAPAGLLDAIKLPPIDPTLHASSGDWNHAEVLSIVKHLHGITHEYVTRGNQNRWKSTLAVRNTGILLTDDLYEYLGYEPGEESKFYTRWERQDRTGDRTFNMQSLKQAAIKTGWSERVLKTTAQMFAGVLDPVAKIAADAGATLSSQAPIPLADTQRVVAALGQPILDNFLAGTRDAPLHPSSSITLPDTFKNHPLFDLLNEAIERILAMAEGGPKKFRQDRVLETIGLLDAVHQPTRESLCQRIRSLGGVIGPGRPEEAAYRFECCVMAEIRTAAGFSVNNKGEPDPKNSDNVLVFLRLRKVKFRFNVLTDRVEISDSDRDAYQPLSDAIFDGLLVDAENGQYNFHPSKEGFRRGIDTAARRVPPFDPLRDKVDTLATAWDGQARLNTWLSMACGVPNDPYHVAVGRNLIGGLVRRARHPGCPHAETVIFISPEQGTGKSTLCKILALDEKWYTDSFKLGGTQQNSLPQLASKWVVELGELAGMSKTEVEDVKQFMTINVDEYVKKYQSFPTEQPRRCVFIGTSNNRHPLQDATGNRRFLPVHVQGEVNLEWIRANVEQLIGECAVREASGESFAIPREVYKEANRHQEAARQMTPVEELCYEWFDRPPGSYFVTASDVGRALKMAGQKGRYAGFMDKMGWRADSLTIPNDGRKCRIWLRHENTRLEECIRLEPVQSQINGPVEMRMRPQVSNAVGFPPLAPIR